MSLTTITTLARALAEWAERPANARFFHQDQDATLVAALDDPRRRPQLHVAAWMLGTWHLGHGFARVMAGDGRGFDEARTGQALRRCSLLLRERHQQPLRRTSAARLPFSQLQGTLTALLGLALHDPGIEPLLELLARQPDAAFAEDAHLALFTRELLVLRAGHRPNATPRLGPWQDVLAHWTGDARLFARSVAERLDAHLQGARTAGSGYDDPPVQIYPFEAIALQNVRTWLGLPTPKIDHPLMFTNLGTMAPQPPWPDDERVRRLERLLR
jgi:hypothetical protein